MRNLDLITGPVSVVVVYDLLMESKVDATSVYSKALSKEKNIFYYFLLSSTNPDKVYL